MNHMDQTKKLQMQTFTLGSNFKSTKNQCKNLSIERRNTLKYGCGVITGVMKTICGYKNFFENKQ